MGCLSQGGCEQWEVRDEMPLLLADRLGDDSIFAFEQAAEQRRVDAARLVAQRRPLAAIYLQGYAVEMAVKAAYFRAVGHRPNQQVTAGDRHLAVSEWQTLGLKGKPGHHEILGWAQLLAAKRTSLSRPYPPGFQSELLAYAKAVSLRWREILRYRVNVPYAHEVRVMATASQWFDQNYPQL